MSPPFSLVNERRRYLTRATTHEDRRQNPAKERLPQILRPPGGTPPRALRLREGCRPHQLAYRWMIHKR